MKISRRKFLQLSTVSAVAVSTAAWSGFEDQSQNIEVTETIIRHASIPPSFNNYRIALLSDIHLGVFVPDELVRKAVQLINDNKPDLVLLNGDYIGIPDSMPGTLFSTERNQKFSGTRTPSLVRSIFHTLATLLSDIRASDGILASCGNHDHWNDSKICMDEFSRTQLRFIINGIYEIQRGTEKLRVYCADDLWTGVPRLTSDFIGEREKSFRILLSHNPDFLAETLFRSGSVFDLGLAGHTHGGQIILPKIGTPYGYNVRYPEFGSGLKSHLNSIVYTSRGLGVVDIPYRINCRPEVTILSLKS